MLRVFLVVMVQTFVWVCAFICMFCVKDKLVVVGVSAYNLSTKNIHLYILDDVLKKR